MTNNGGKRGDVPLRNTRKSINRNGRNGQPVRRGSYNSGMTAYEHRGGRENPYRQSNMIYREPPQRHWGRLIAIVAVIFVLIALISFACHNGGRADQPAEQTQEQSVARAPVATAASSDASTDAASAAASSAASSDQRLDTEDEEGVTRTTTDAGAISITRTPENRMQTSDSTNDEKPAEKTVYLTFDDGPSSNTHKILDILNRYGVHATWFVIKARGHLDYTPDIWNAGNQVALHSNTHEYDDDYKNDTAYLAGLDQVNDELQNYLGFKSTLLRFPGGSVNDFNKKVRPAIVNEIAQRQWHYFDWNVESGDATGNGVPAKTLVKNIKTESKGNKSCCVLMHDTEAKDTTVEALPQIIEYYIKHGYAFDVLTANAYGYHF